MNPFKFEQFVGDLLNMMGFKTRVTKPTGDGGVDIEAEHETPTGANIEYVVQVKRHTNIISPKELQALVGAMQGLKTDRCIFITTSSFSSKSVEYAERMKTIELVDGIKLIELIREHGILPETLAKIGESRISVPVCSADEGMRLGKEAYSRGDYEGALKYFDRVINLEPENDEAWVWKGKSDINKKLFSIFPSVESLKRLSTAQYSRVLLSWIQGQIDPYLGFLYLGTDISTISRNRKKLNLNDFEKAGEINPDNIEAWLYANPEKAHELCNERLRVNPNDEEALLIKGKIRMADAYIEMDSGLMVEEAKKCFNKVVELSPKNEEALFYLGVVVSILDGSVILDRFILAEPEYKTYKKFRKAFNYFERCSEINPDNYHYTELVEAIKAVIKTEEKKEEIKKEEIFEKEIQRISEQRRLSEQSSKHYIGEKIGAWGVGLAALLGAGVVLLAVLDNPMWPIFLMLALWALIISILIIKKPEILGNW